MGFVLRSAFTLIITIVMLVFTMQLSIIHVIKINETLIKSLIQNPITEEEEEEERVGTETNKFWNNILYSIIQIDYLNFFAVNIRLFYFKNSSIPYYSYLKQISEPPESNLKRLS